MLVIVANRLGLGERARTDRHRAKQSLFDQAEQSVGELAYTLVDKLRAGDEPTVAHGNRRHGADRLRGIVIPQKNGIAPVSGEVPPVGLENVAEAIDGPVGSDKRRLASLEVESDLLARGRVIALQEPAGRSELGRRAEQPAHGELLGRAELAASQARSNACLERLGRRLLDDAEAAHPAGDPENPLPTVEHG